MNPLDIDKFIGQVVAGLLLLFIFALAGWWFKSSYDKSVITKNEVKVAAKLSKTMATDTAKTDALTGARAADQRQAAGTFIGLKSEGALDAQNHPEYRGCRLSADGLRVLNGALRAAGAAEPVYAAGAGGLHGAGGDTGGVAPVGGGAGSAGAEGVGGAAPVPGGLDQRGTQVRTP